MKKKRWSVKLKINIEPGSSLYAWVYIEAAQVRRAGHDRVIADGVCIDLPGNLYGRIQSKDCR